MTSVWTSMREGVELSDELVGFAVEGTDGKIGKVDHVNYTGTCLTVASGLLKKTSHVIPAAAVQEVDLETESIFVRLTTDQVSESPEYDPVSGVDEACEARVAEYYDWLIRS